MASWLGLCGTLPAVVVAPRQMVGVNANTTVHHHLRLPAGRTPPLSERRLGNTGPTRRSPPPLHKRRASPVCAAAAAIDEADMPPIVLSNVPGTWAYDTMSRRVREEILSRVFLENELTEEQLTNLKALDQELQEASTSPLRYIKQDGGPDVQEWNTLMAPFVETASNWLDTPWLYAEFYFYRRIIEAIGYFENQKDPFLTQKLQGLSSAADIISTLTTQLQGVVESVPEASAESVRADISLFILTSLWGNRMDLSLWPADGDKSRAAEAFKEAIASGEEHLLADDIMEVEELLMSARAMGGKRMDIVVDNAGFELLCDLCLADILVMTGCSFPLVLQLKGHPTFVSDAMTRDVEDTIAFLVNLGGVPAAVGQRWREHIDQGRWVLKEVMYWAQPLPFWEMPVSVTEDLKSSALVFQKGDANYRRLLGDREWPMDKPFAEVAGYYPAPLCALRTLKAELGCGMSVKGMAQASSEDENWRTNGRWGVIQLHQP